MNSFKNQYSMKRLVNKLRSRKESKVEDILVIGIDFGTTFSGAAWATIEDFEADQINLILAWPGYGREEGKAPTAIYYDEYYGANWGYDISIEVTPLQWFKLLLLRREDLPVEVQQSNALLTAKRMLKESGKSEVDVIADYLRVLWRHTISTIRRDRGEVVLNAYELHVVLTVPAAWQGYARQAMREAAKKAGIMDSRPSGCPTLSLAPEPEAAAMATLCEYGRSLSKDDVYIICDAGGGTVDLVNYQITDTEPLELRAVGIGTGGLCGSIFIDEVFRAMCKDRLGRAWNKLSSAGVREIMTKEWELGIKPQFKPQNTGREYIVSIPAEAVGKFGLNDPSKGIKNGRIHFSSHEIEQAFAKVFTDIVGLIDGQLQQARNAGLSVTGVILVGGLGSSAYLYDYLSSKFKSRRIRILQSSGMKPRTAICRGAIYKGFIDGPNSSDDRGFTVASPVHVVTDSRFSESRTARHNPTTSLRGGYVSIDQSSPLTLETASILGDYASVDQFSSLTFDTAPLLDDAASVGQFSLLTLDGHAEQQIADEINTAEALLDQGSFVQAYPRFQLALILLSNCPTPMPSSFHCHAHLGMAECRISASDDKTKERALEYLRSAHKHALKAIDHTDDASLPAAQMALLVMKIKETEMEAGPDGMAPIEVSELYWQLNEQIEVLQELIDMEEGTPQRMSYKGLLTRGEDWRRRLIYIGSEGQSFQGLPPHYG